MKPKKSKADVWMPFYVGDYLADTMHLSAAEHGAYLMLILHYWKSGPIPDEDARLANITKLGDAWSISSSTLRAFFAHRDGMLVHDRIDEEKAGAIVNQDKNKARATAAANKRWGKDAAPDATSTAQAVPKQCPSPSPSPSPNGDKDSNGASAPKGEVGFDLVGDAPKEIPKPKKPKAKPEYDAEFQRAWSRYPKRNGPNPMNLAAKNWAARLREGHSADEMIAGVERYAAHCLAEGKVGTIYTMQAKRFFSEEKVFLIEYSAAQQVTGNHRQGQPSTQHVNGIDYSSSIELAARLNARHNIPTVSDSDDPVVF